MKNVIIAAGLILILVFTAVTSLTIYSHNSRQNEVEEALSVAVEQSMENLMISKQYSISNTEEFIADFTQRLILGIDSKSNITVNILAVDIEKGLLDVEVVETYRQMNGTDGVASYRKTVILEEGTKNTPTQYTVTFKVERGHGSGNFQTYKVFTITSGNPVIFPGAEPTMGEQRFLGWSLTEPSAENNYKPQVEDKDNPPTVDKELTLYAVFE